MTRTNHRDRNPDFKFPQGQGYKPEREPVSLGQIILGFVCWLGVLAVGTATALPIALHLVRWVVGHD